VVHNSGCKPTTGSRPFETNYIAAFFLAQSKYFFRAKIAQPPLSEPIVLLFYLTDSNIHVSLPVLLMPLRLYNHKACRRPLESLSWPSSVTIIGLMWLRIDVSQEDSGNYTCEVRGPQSTLLGHVTHYLFVRGIINSVLC